jgi:hypothetical protein
MNEPIENIFIKSKVIRRRVSGNQTRDDNPRMKRVLKRRLKGETQEDHLDLNNTTIGRDGRCKFHLPLYLLDFFNAGSIRLVD